MTGGSIGPTSDIEERRNQHREKAYVLLRLAEAVEDSNQRRRRASTAAAKATTKELGLLSHDLQSQAAKLQHHPPPHPLAPPSTPDTTEAVQATIVNVVTAVYHLREHAHLQYQMLEMKYFDLKRHAFDVENQNRKLQLQLSFHSTNSTGNHHHHHHQVHPASVDAQHDELMAQLQQENDDLRKQLRESCAESRKLVQENYGLRKILLDAGVGPSCSSPTATTTTTTTTTSSSSPRAAGEERKAGDEDSESDSEQIDDFEDAQEFIDPIPEETPKDLDDDDSNGNNRKSKAKSATVEESAAVQEMHAVFEKGIYGNGERSTDVGKDTTVEATPTKEEPEVHENVESEAPKTVNTAVDAAYNAIFRQPQPRTYLTHKDPSTELKPPQPNLATSSFESALESQSDETTPPAVSPTPDTAIPISRSMSITSTSTAHTTDTFGTAGDASTIYQSLVKRKRSSRKSVTFAAMANKLAQANGSSSVSSFGSSFRHDDNDSVSTFNTTNTEDVRRREKHDRNMALAGGRFAATTVTPELQNQRSFSNLSTTSNVSSSSSRRTVKPSSQAVTAKELMRKSNKQAMTAKELMRKQGGKRSNNNNNNNNATHETFHILMSSVAPPRSTNKMQVSKPIDPVEEEKRLSALLGGFRSGNSSKTTLADDVSSVVSSVSTTHKKSIFRRRKSHRSKDNDDDSVTSSKSLGFLFNRRPSSSVKG